MEQEKEVAGETAEIPEEIQSIKDSQESRTTEGKRQSNQQALAEEEEDPAQDYKMDDFQLEEDSEVEEAPGAEQVNGNENSYGGEEEVEEDVQRNGYGAEEMLTETAEDQLTSAYGEEDAYYASSQNNNAKQIGQAGQTGSGSYMSQSYLTKNSRSMGGTHLD